MIIISKYLSSELRPKEHLEFSEDGTILSYRQPKSYVFEPSLSAGSEDDNFTSVNLPLLVSWWIIFGVAYIRGFTVIHTCTCMNYRKTSNISHTKYQNLNFLTSSWSCLCPIHWSQVLSWEWRCSWSSANRQCSNCISVINKFIAYRKVWLILEFWQ